MVSAFTVLMVLGCLYSEQCVCGAPGGDRTKQAALCQDLCGACNGQPRLDGSSCMCQVDNEKDLECLQTARRKAIDRGMKLVPRLVENQYNDEASRYQTRHPTKSPEYLTSYLAEAPKYEGSRYPRCVGSALVGAVREKLKLRQDARLASKASAASARAVVGAKTLENAVSSIVGAQTPEAVVGAEHPSDVGEETPEDAVGAENPAAEAKETETESENVVGAAKSSALSAEKSEASVAAKDKGAVLGSQAVPAKVGKAAGFNIINNDASI